LKTCYAFCDGRYPQWTRSIKELKSDWLDPFCAHSSINVAESSVTYGGDKFTGLPIDKYEAVRVNVFLQQVCRTALKMLAIIGNEAKRVQKEVMDTFGQRLEHLDEQARKLGEETLKDPKARKYLE
jgi:hypothetical protein